MPLLKKRLWHRCFPLNFAKFLRAPLLQNTSGRLLLIIDANLMTKIKVAKIAKIYSISALINHEKWMHRNIKISLWQGLPEDVWNDILVTFSHAAFRRNYWWCISQLRKLSLIVRWKWIVKFMVMAWIRSFIFYWDWAW